MATTGVVIEKHFNKNRLTGGRICDWEMMLLGRLFCRLSVVISAQVTWKPVIR